jgi:hypothetical protein
MHNIDGIAHKAKAEAYLSQYDISTAISCYQSALEYGCSECIDPLKELLFIKGISACDNEMAIDAITMLDQPNDNKSMYFMRYTHKRSPRICKSREA